MINTKWMFLPDYYCCADTLQKKLEEQALKGWRLDKFWRCGIFVFYRVEPQRLHYFVDLFPYGSDFDTVVIGRAEDYVSCCQAAGWELEAMRGRVYIFAAEDPDLPPIQTDPQLRFQSINRAMLRAILCCVTFALLGTAMVIFYALDGWGVLFNADASLRLRLCEWSTFVMVFLLALLGSAGTVSYLIWRAVNRKRLGREEPLWMGGHWHIGAVAAMMPVIVLARGYFVYALDYGVFRAVLTLLVGLLVGLFIRWYWFGQR